MRPIPARVTERAATRYTVVGTCWVSTYARGSHGYAQIGWRDPGHPHPGPSAMELVHRAAWVYHHGPIPGTLTVDHNKAAGCTDRGCVNPAHLRLLPNVVNASDNGGEARRTRAPAGVVCSCGEERVQADRGRTVCRSCAARYRRAWRARRRLAGLPKI